MMRAAIALGSNLGDRLASLQSARDRIRALDGVTEPTVQSAVYETSPVDCEPGAQNFYNAVIEVGFEKSADAFLEALQDIERALGRERITPSPQSSPRGEEDAGRGCLGNQGGRPYAKRQVRARFHARSISICCISVVNAAPMQYCNCRIRE